MQVDSLRTEQSEVDPRARFRDWTESRLLDSIRIHLRGERGRLFDWLETIPFGVVLVSELGCVYAANGLARRWLGLARRPRGRNLWLDLWDPPGFEPSLEVDAWLGRVADGERFEEACELGGHDFHVSGRSLGLTAHRAVGALFAHRVRESTPTVDGLEEGDEAFWVRSADESGFLFLSPNCARLREVPVGELMLDGEQWFRSIHPYDLARVRRAYRKARAGVLDVEYRILRSDGRVRWVRDRARVIDSEGAFRLVGTSRDVTELKACIRSGSTRERRLNQRRLASMIELVRTRAERSRYECVDLSGLLVQVVGLRTKQDPGLLTATRVELPTVIGDRDRLRRLFAHLLGATSIVRGTVRARARRFGDFWGLRFVVEGQVDEAGSEDRMADLAIARRIVSQHGGELRVSRTPGRVSIVFTHPLRQPGVSLPS